MLGLQWIPNSEKYIFYTENWKKMMVADAKNHKATEFITITDINNALNVNLKSFFGVEFIDSYTILITNKRKY